MKQIIVRETKWEIRFQDGPAENGIYYDTEDAAKAELATWHEGHCACVRPVTREYPLAAALASDSQWR